jgi:hypothetical protein
VPPSLALWFESGAFRPDVPLGSSSSTAGRRLPPSRRGQDRRRRAAMVCPAIGHEQSQCQDMEFEVHDARSRPAAPLRRLDVETNILRLVPGRWSRAEVSSSPGAASPGLVCGDAGGSSVTCSSVSVTRRCPLLCRIARVRARPSCCQPGKWGRSKLEQSALGAVSWLHASSGGLRYKAARHRGPYRWRSGHAGRRAVLGLHPYDVGLDRLHLHSKDRIGRATGRFRAQRLAAMLLVGLA